MRVTENVDDDKKQNDFLCIVIPTRVRYSPYYLTRISSRTNKYCVFLFLFSNVFYSALPGSPATGSVAFRPRSFVSRAYRIRSRRTAAYVRGRVVLPADKAVTCNGVGRKTRRRCGHEHTCFASQADCKHRPVALRITNASDALTVNDNG